MRKALLSLQTNRFLPDRRAARLLGRRIDGAADAVESSSGSGIADLEQVLDRYGADALLTRDSVGAQALRSAIRLLAAEAREHDPVRGERLLIAVRCAWRDFPEVRRMAEQGLRDELWSHLVHLCCEEFYGPRVPRQALRSA